MITEDQHTEHKSLRTVTGKTADWGELAKDCVCFANARGGRIIIGIEDGKGEPPEGQILPPKLLEKIVKRVGELTVNVTIALEVLYADKGSQCLELRIARAHAPASTTDGRYYMRIADDCKPLIGNDIQRLLDERSSQPWETLTTLRISQSRVDSGKLASFVAGIRASDRVKSSVKEKTSRNSWSITCWRLTICSQILVFCALAEGRSGQCSVLPLLYSF